MNLNLKTAITAVVSVVFVGTAAKQSLEIHRTEAAKRAQIKADKLLDLRAIARAQASMGERISSGDYPIGSLRRLQSDMQSEIEFQKIAIRSEF